MNSLPLVSIVQPGVSFDFWWWNREEKLDIGFLLTDLHHLCLLKNLQHSSISTAPQITNVVMFITEVSWPLVRNSTSFSNYWLFEPLPSSCTTIIIINFYNYFTWVLIIWPVTTHNQKAKFISVIIKIITITAPIVHYIMNMPWQWPTMLTMMTMTYYCKRAITERATLDRIILI